MRSVVYTQYGAPDVLQIVTTDKPVPEDDQVLVKVMAVPVSFGDITARKFNSIKASEFSMPVVFWFLSKLVFGFTKPKINVLGSEFAGVVVQAGKNVNKFKPGDRIYGYLGAKFGAYSEYICVSESGAVSKIPENISFDDACAVSYGAIFGLSFVKRGGVKNGTKVLINGASGAIGSAALQFSKYYGAEVTAVCGTDGIEYVKALGADKTVDYTKENATLSTHKYDLIIDVPGKIPFKKSVSILTDNGIHLYVSFKMKQLLQSILTRMKGGKQVVCVLSSEKNADFELINNLLSSGIYKTLTRQVFRLEQIAEAHRLAEAGHKKGNIVVKFDHNL